MTDAILMEGFSPTKEGDEQPASAAETETATELKMLLRQALELLRGCYDENGSFSYDTFENSRDKLRSVTDVIGMYVEEVQQVGQDSLAVLGSNVASIYELLRKLPFDDHGHERIKQQDSLSALLYNTLTGMRMSPSRPLGESQMDRGGSFTLNAVMELEKKGLPLAVSIAAGEIEKSLSS